MHNPKPQEGERGRRHKLTLQIAIRRGKVTPLRQSKEGTIFKSCRLLNLGCCSPDKNVLILEQAPAKKSDQLILKLKFYWNKAMPICLHIVCGCFCVTRADWGVATETMGPQSLTYWLSGLLRKSFLPLSQWRGLVNGGSIRYGVEAALCLWCMWWQKISAASTHFSRKEKDFYP